MQKIIVVGAGTAGMCCAIRAAECGAQVVVIEKDGVVGGTLHLTAGHLSAGGTRRQAEKGIEDSPAQHYADVMRISKNTANPEIVKLATDLAPQTIDWLQSLDFPFEPDTPKFIYGHVPYQIPRTHWGTTSYEGTEIKWAGSTIFNTIKPIWDQLVAEGKIELHLNTKMTGLLVESGKVVGVEVESVELKGESVEVRGESVEVRGESVEVRGESVEVRGESIESEIFPLTSPNSYRAGGPAQFHISKSVVLTTGGYGSNPAFFRQMHPDWRLVSTARETSTGDGILAALAIGAQFHNADKHTATLGGLELDFDSGRTDFWKNWCRVSNSVDRKPREIYVNADSQRFMDENEADVDKREKTVEAQHGQKMWVIFDEKALCDAGGSIVPQWTPDQLKAEARQERAVWQADSVDELAEKTGLDAVILGQTIERFNDFVINQHDPDFGRTHLENAVREAPFYAILTHCFSLVTFGGLATNADLQVLDQQQKPIPNLYAAGEILGGGVTCGHAFVGGMFLTPALSFGRYLGEKLANDSLSL